MLYNANFCLIMCMIEKEREKEVNKLKEKEKNESKKLKKAIIIKTKNADPGIQSTLNLHAFNLHM